jgi:hypothetical protein
MKQKPQNNVKSAHYCEGLGLFDLNETTDLISPREIQQKFGTVIEIHRLSPWNFGFSTRLIVFCRILVTCFQQLV